MACCHSSAQQRKSTTGTLPRKLSVERTKVATANKARDDHSALQCNAMQPTSVHGTATSVHAPLPPAHTYVGVRLLNIGRLCRGREGRGGVCLSRWFPRRSHDAWRAMVTMDDARPRLQATILCRGRVIASPKTLAALLGFISSRR